MEERVPPAESPIDRAAAVPEREMQALVRAYPGLDDLEPYYIEWELIWPM